MAIPLTQTHSFSSNRFSDRCYLAYVYFAGDKIIARAMRGRVVQNAYKKANRLLGLGSSRPMPVVGSFVAPLLS